MSAVATYKTFLMKDDAKLVDISSFPDMGGEPEMLDLTTLSDKMKKYILGIQDTQSLTFETFYDPDTYPTLEVGANTEDDFALWLGGTEGSNGTVTPTGVWGKFSWTGSYSVYLSGGGVNEPHKVTITMAPSTVISYTAGSSTSIGG